MKGSCVMNILVKRHRIGMNQDLAVQAQVIKLTQSAPVEYNEKKRMRENVKDGYVFRSSLS